MVAENPPYELSAEELTEAALRVGRINQAYLRLAKMAGLYPNNIYDDLRIGDGLGWQGRPSFKLLLFANEACELIRQRMNLVVCPSHALLTKVASHSNPRRIEEEHVTGCDYCREEVESMRPVMAPS